MIYLILGYMLTAGILNCQMYYKYEVEKFGQIENGLNFVFVFFAGWLIQPWVLLGRIFGAR